jgi:hypothetical protein
MLPVAANIAEPELDIPLRATMGGPAVDWDAATTSGGRRGKGRGGRREEGGGRREAGSPVTHRTTWVSSVKVNSSLSLKRH